MSWSTDNVAAMKSRDCRPICVSVALCLGGSLVAGCAPEGDESDHGSADVVSSVQTFDEFVDSLPRDPSDGAYLVEDDIGVTDRADLLPYYQRQEQSSALTILQTISGSTRFDQPWPVGTRMALKYCIATAGARKFQAAEYATLKAAFDEATAAWENATRLNGGPATIDFQHVVAADANCTPTNGTVVFAVQLADDMAPYRARSFNPTASASQRILYVHPRIFTAPPTSGEGSALTVAGTFKHELGHVLGFVHEHLRAPPGGVSCTDDPFANRAVSQYDVGSVMAYKNLKQGTNGGCTTTGVKPDVLTSYDVAGARCIYNSAADACKGVRLSGAARQFAADASGTIYRLTVTATQTLIERGAINPTVSPLPVFSTIYAVTNTNDTASIIAGGSQLYRVSSAGAVLRRSGGAWTNIGTTQSGLAVARSTGQLFRALSTGAIERFDPGTSAWTNAYTPVGAGVRKLFEGHGKVFRQDPNGDVSIWSSGTTWTKVWTANANITVRNVVEDATGLVYMLGSDGVARLWGGGGSALANWVVVSSGVARLWGSSLDTLYFSLSASPTLVQRYLAGAPVGAPINEPFAQGVAAFFSGGWARYGVSSSASADLYDYLVPL